MSERREAHERFGEMFALDNIDDLSEDDFEFFLKDNKSWSGLHRHPEILENTEKVKKGIRHLQNEEIDVKERLRNVVEYKDSEYWVNGMGQNIATAILYLCDENDQYGVLNNRSVKVLKKLEMIPEDLPSSIGDKYNIVNEALNELKKFGLNNLGKVDFFLYWVDEKNPSPPKEGYIEALKDEKWPEKRIEKYEEFEKQARDIIENNLGDLDKSQIGKLIDEISTGYWRGEEKPTRRFRNLVGNKSRILENGISELNKVITGLYKNENPEVDKPPYFANMFSSILLYLKDRGKYNIMINKTVEAVNKVFSDANLSDDFGDYYSFNRYANKIKFKANLRPQEMDALLTKVAREDISPKSEVDEELAEEETKMERESEEDKDYFWVTQKKDKEIEEDYIEAPAGSDRHSHDLEKVVRATNPIIFHCDNRREAKIIGFSEPRDSEEIEIDEENLFRVYVDFHQFDESIKLEDVVDNLVKDSDRKYFPINEKRELNQQYLSELTQRAGDYLLKYVEDKSEANKIYRDTKSEKGLEEILNDVFLNDEDAENAREYLVNLFRYLGDPDNLKSQIVVTYDDRRKKISVNFGHWQVFSIDRKGNKYYSQFVVDRSELPQEYTNWSEFEKEKVDFKRAEEKKLIRLQWKRDLFRKHPELERAWEHAIEFAKSEFKEWSRSPYHPHHREDIYDWIMGKFPKPSQLSREPEFLEEFLEDLTVFDGDLEIEIEGLHFEDEMKGDIFDRIETALRNGDHILLIGPPGTGKSKLAKQLCESIVGSDYKLVTATSDWSTFDTIGGYHPEEEQELVFKPGVFLNRFQEENGTPKNEWLIIDEINRADIDKAFGSLFSALTGDNVTLPFTDENGNNIEIVGDLDSEDKMEVKPYRYFIPEDWRIISTMNTFDKTSLYEMSYAFMRRLAFIPIEIPDEINTELIREYVDVWNDVGYDGEKAKDIGKIWKIVNNSRRIGPAVIEDIYKYVMENGDRDYTSPLIMHVLPQFEGLTEDELREFLENLEEDVEDIVDIDELKEFVSDYFQIPKDRLG